MKYICAFLGGAIAGAAAAVLMAPEKGSDMRAHVREALRRYGVIKGETDEVIVEQIAAEIEAETPKKK